eukprot:3612029-Rhodomonas_salina.2
MTALQYNLYEECGFFHLISERTCSSAGDTVQSAHCGPRSPVAPYAVSVPRALHCKYCAVARNAVSPPSFAMQARE